MSNTVHDLTLCPQCLAPAESTLNLDDRTEQVACERCGYTQHEHDQGVTVHDGHGTRLVVTPTFQTIQPLGEREPTTAPVPDHCTRLAVRCPPLYRLEFQYGEPEPHDPEAGRDWNAYLRWGHLRAALVRLGEAPHALLDSTLYTVSMTGQPGFRTFHAHLTGDALHVSLPGQPPFLIANPQGAYLSLHAETEVLRG